LFCSCLLSCFVSLLFSCSFFAFYSFVLFECSFYNLLSIRSIVISYLGLYTQSIGIGSNFNI
jgi:hypothetical protein